MIKKLLNICFIIFLFGCQIEVLDDTKDDDFEKVSVLENEGLNSSFIFWHGRTHYVAPNMYFYYTGTGIFIEFYGRIVDIDFILEEKQAAIYYRISKDGSSLLEGDIFIQQNPKDTLTVTFDTYDFHQIEIVKVSEPEDGMTGISKIATNGYFLEPQLKEKLHFLIIGASGISGHGALGSPGEARTTANSSSLHSFGYLTAHYFHGTYEFVAHSGWGLVYGFNDKSGVENIQKAYEHVGIHPNETVIEIPYINQKPPDIIIVNIGGNDFTSVINPATGFDQQTKLQNFKDGVAAFVLRLRKAAPDAHIIWTMTAGSQNGTHALNVFSMLDEVDQTFVHMIEIEAVGSNGDLPGANNHASYITHQKSAQKIIDYLISLGF